MTNHQLIIDALIKTGPMCDDCLSVQSNVKPRQTVNINCRSRSDLTRSKDQCPVCRSTKIVNRFSSKDELSKVIENRAATSISSPEQRVSSQINILRSEFLVESGFKESGEWLLNEGNIRLSSEPPTSSGVYAKVVNSEVVYIGVATKNLKQRLNFYRNPGNSQSTNIRLKAKIIEVLESGMSVEILIAMPKPGSWNGLPVDYVTGLEFALIERYQPTWNKKGVS